MTTKRKPKTSTRIRKAPAGPTRVSEAPIARLKRAGALNVHELTASDEIAAAYSMSIGEPAARDPDLGIRSEPRPDAADSAAARRSDVLRCYAVWRSDLRGTAALAAATGILIEEKPLRAIERAWHWRSGSATGHLRIAIRHFAALRGNAPRGARSWKYAVTVNRRVDS